MYTTVIDLKETMYTDQTGKCPYLSSREYQYVMVGIHVEANYIFQEPMKNKTAKQNVEAYQRIFARMNACVLSTKKHILDNKISAEYKEAITNNNINYQLAPADNHRRNIAECAIQTAKAHFISVLAGVHTSFPMHLWCRLLKGAKLQLNHLRQSNVCPKISASAHVHGPINFMHHPFAPLGCPVLARKSQETEAVGVTMQLTLGILGRPWNTMTVSPYTTKQQEQKVYETSYFSNTNTSPHPLSPKKTQL